MRNFVFDIEIENLRKFGERIHLTDEIVVIVEPIEDVIGDTYYPAKVEINNYGDIVLHCEENNRHVLNLDSFRRILFETDRNSSIVVNINGKIYYTLELLHSEKFGEIAILCISL